jgi:GNAT superfamily N-acetyltransferase
MNADTLTARLRAERAEQVRAVERAESERLEVLIVAARVEFRARFQLVDFYIGRNSAGGVVLSGLRVSPGRRNFGHGSEFMRALVAWADCFRLTLSLTPEPESGRSKERLKRFYRRFGFVSNFTGRNSDYSISESMYRRPASAGGA